MWGPQRAAELSKPVSLEEAKGGHRFPEAPEGGAGQERGCLQEPEPSFFLPFFPWLLRRNPSVTGQARFCSRWQPAPGRVQGPTGLRSRGPSRLFLAGAEQVATVPPITGAGAAGIGVTGHSGAPVVSRTSKAGRSARPGHPRARGASRAHGPGEEPLLPHFSSLWLRYV